MEWRSFWDTLDDDVFVLFEPLSDKLVLLDLLNGKNFLHRSEVKEALLVSSTPIEKGMDLAAIGQGQQANEAKDYQFNS